MLYQRLNNPWGWNSARTGFLSVEHGIDYITRQLAEGRPYRNRDLEQKLMSYNPYPAYVKLVKRVMSEIDE
jgi:hypothetical protein